MTELPGESVQMVCTSPPYWGLRKYAGVPDLIWGGVKGCEHRWQDNTYVRNNDQTAGEKQKTNLGAIGRDEPIDNAFCSICGAWKGSLGLEPEPSMYVEHMVQIFEEVKRVLRKDGVCFVNIGDSYAGSWGSMSHDLNVKAKKTGTNERPPTSFVGKQRGGQSGKCGKELLDSTVNGFFSENPCGECVRILLNRNSGTYDYPSLALAISDVLSNHSHKEQPIDHSDNSRSTSPGDHSVAETSGLCSFVSFLDGAAHGVQGSTKPCVSGEFPLCQHAQVYSYSPSLRQTFSSWLPQSNDGVCPFWLYLLSHGIQGLTESISNTLEIDDSLKGNH